MKIVIAILAIVIFGAGAIFFLTAEPRQDHTVGNTNSTNPISSFVKKITNSSPESTSSSKSVSWENSGSGYIAIGTPPDCPDPLVLETPVDLSKAFSILYPGQIRGGDYKAHGGFRFDGQSGDGITVTIPMDAVLVDGSRYLESGNVQYLFSFINPCGIMYRFDHISVLADKFQPYADQLPEPKADDSRTTNYQEKITVRTGEVFATAVGSGDNVFVDFGVYDLRQKNGVVDDQFDSLTEYGVCWFDLLSEADEEIVRALPAGSSDTGSQSDYCK